MLIFQSKYLFYINFCFFWFFSVSFFLHHMQKEQLFEEENYRFWNYVTVSSKYVTVLFFFLYFHDTLIFLYDSGWIQTSLQAEIKLVEFKVDTLKIIHDTDKQELNRELGELVRRQNRLNQWQIMAHNDLTIKIQAVKRQIEILDESFYKSLREILKKHR